MMRTLGDQAKDFRLARDWNTTQMGEAVETSRQNIEALEAHGNRIPKYIGRLSRLLGVTVDDMLVEAGLAEPLPAPPPWPFAIPLYARFSKLTQKDRGIVEGKLEAAIEAIESRGLSPEAAAVKQKLAPLRSDANTRKRSARE